jgi:hypothetical protein
MLLLLSSMHLEQRHAAVVVELVVPSSMLIVPHDSAAL